VGQVVAIQEVLDFWFVECSPPDWFKKDPAFDALILKRFGETFESALAGDLGAWLETPAGCLALILVLDQFPRNMYRDTPKGFSGDAKALEISDRCRERGYVDQAADERWRHFMLIPMMHSEDIAVQEASLPLFERHTSERVVEYAIRHRDIIKRFGRYPHRNIILGRQSTEEELRFLASPGSSF
jgi:uncharacterized protein (DUF924 family)